MIAGDFDGPVLDVVAWLIIILGCVLLLLGLYAATFGAAKIEKNVARNLRSIVRYISGSDNE